MNNFIHLHVHSEYSLLDSSLKISSLINKAKSLNMAAIALTDHGNILGAVNFYKQASAAGVRPIIGSEMYVASGSRKEKPQKRGDINYFHLLVLVKNDKGYRNLSELISLSFTEGFYRKPRIDKEVLVKYKEGLIIMSACIQGEIPYYFLNGREDKAYEAARWYKENFKDDFYIEIQNHALSDQLMVLPRLTDLSKDLQIPLVATNDVHYLNREDADAREILICLQTNNILSDPARPMKKECDEMYLKSREEMQVMFKDDKESLDITLDIAAKCNFGFKLGTYHLPNFKVPDDQSIESFFQTICWDGYKRIEKDLDANKTDNYKTRLTFEIEKIIEMGFAGYFLIVWDIIRFARNNHIPVGPGRGSVVGSLVAYVMRITTIDPLKYDLIFERFLNPERISLPDIDIDFDGERRDKIIEYIRQKYGTESVAQIVTFGKMKAKMAIRDIGRVLDIKLADVNRIAKLIPEGPKVKLKDELKDNVELQKEIKRLPEAGKLIEYALKLENTIRHTSMHAAGVVIAPERLTEFLPLYKTKDDIVTQFEKDEVEEIGLLKMDILGLKTLTIVKNILSEIDKREGKKIDLDTIPLNDPKTFTLFQQGNTDGIFQFESTGMREYLKRSKPQRIEDLIVLNGLYRPGPLESGMAEKYIQRKRGEEEVTYLFPQMEEQLADTYGIIVFQEQVMKISQVIAGFSLAKADQMRKIMGKKLEFKIRELEGEFISGGVKKGHDRKKLEKLFLQIKTFARYGFNKSHSAAYAYLAYQTAFLKAHYPVYFMCANLTSECEKTSTTSKIIQYISECKKMGIKILPPDLNKSIENFQPEGEGMIRFGLRGLKNVGTAAIASIISARDQGGEFKNLSEFILRIDLSKVNKAVLESLIKAGVLDCFGVKRKILFDNVEDIIKQASAIEKLTGKNQRSLFGRDNNLFHKINISGEQLEKEEWIESEVIKGEREIAGIYLSQNPLEKFDSDIARTSNTRVSQLKEFKGATVKMGGVFTDVSQLKSKRGTFYGQLYFEDMTGRVKVLAFKDTWKKFKSSLKIDFPYHLEARMSDSDEKGATLFMENIIPLNEFLKKRARKIVVKIKYEKLSDEFINSLKQAFENNRDSIPYVIVVEKPGSQRFVLAASDRDEGLEPSLAMKKEVEELTGENSVEILY